MAFSNTYDQTNTGSAVSNREQLLDVLTILAPEETPLLPLAKKSKATSTNVQWTVDGLASPVANGISEGEDVNAFVDKFAGRARLGNYVQKFRRPFMVSDLQQAVDSVGPARQGSWRLRSLQTPERERRSEGRAGSVCRRHRPGLPKDSGLVPSGQKPPSEDQALRHARLPPHTVVRPRDEAIWNPARRHRCGRSDRRLCNRPGLLAVSLVAAGSCAQTR